jgi:hypothetical protein
LRQSGLAHTRHVLDQQVTAREQADHTERDLFSLAHDDRANLINELCDLRGFDVCGSA